MAPVASAGARDDEHQGSNNDCSEAVVNEATEATTTATVEGGSTGSHPSGVAGLIVTLSSTIDDNLRLFRTGAATVVIGSTLTASFLVYRRGVHGFRSAAQVPASYFERRKRVRVRVANVIAAAPPVSDDSGNSHHPVDLLGRESREGKLLDPTLGGKREMGRPRGSDVLVHAEHITIFRRLLRLPPRSLPSRGGDDSSATFLLRLCGVSAEEDGLAFAREQLIKQSAGLYCDAELLFWEERPGDGGGFSTGGSSSGQQASMPVAVCHVHRRRGVLWRDWFQSSLDPKAGLGEHLLLGGLATLREETWWAGDNSNASLAARTAPAHFADIASSGGTDSYHPPALQRLITDRARFVSAEEKAERERRGLWAEFVETGGEGTGTGESTGRGWRDRSASVVRVLKGLFTWR